MRKLLMLFFLVGCMISLFYTVLYLSKIYHSTSTSLFPIETLTPKYRISFIAPELANPLWKAVQEGANEEARGYDTQIIFGGTTKLTLDQLTKQMEVAIASKVDGIIVMAVDHPDFTRVVDKATAKGIPVITIIIDAPDSLRKAYVGTDHYSAGIVVGQHLAQAMEEEGKIGVVLGNSSAHYQVQRLKGVKDALLKYPHITLVEALSKTEGRTQAFESTKEMLNNNPDINAFIGMGAEDVAGMIRAIQSRTKIDEYYIFSFDESSEILTLVEEGVIDAAVGQDPKQMGKNSVRLMLQWLEGKDLPLPDSLYTPIVLQTREYELRK